MSIKDQDLQIYKGAIVTGRVAYITPYYATLDLEHGNRAYLNINQFAIVKPSSLEDVLSIGDELDVKLLFFRPERQEWEVSKLAIDGPKLLQQYGLIGKQIKATIIRFVDTAILLELGDNFIGRLQGLQFTVLLNARMLQLGQMLNVIVVDWDKNGKDVHVAIAFHDDSIGIVPGEVRTLVKSLGKRKSYLRKRLLVKLETGDICECSASNLINVESRFPPGTIIKCKAKLTTERSKWPLIGEVMNEVPEYNQPPPLGTELELAVHSVRGYGAFCVVADNVLGFMHISTAISDTVPELCRYLKPGDKIRVRVVNAKDRKYTFQLEFIKLVEKYDAEDKQDESSANLFDLSDEAKYKRQIQFQRSQKFRENVLTAFNDCCVFCGVYQKINEDYSAAEAAHIIPRGKRGSDLLENALCLCGFHHWAFDRGLIGIEENGSIIVSSEIDAKSELGKTLMALDGQKATTPPQITLSPEALRWHKRNVFIN